MWDLDLHHDWINKDPRRLCEMLPDTKVLKTVCTSQAHALGVDGLLLALAHPL